jgi:putative RNA 2'-phosphotransferase
MPKKNLIKTENLCRLMIYILGHKPYEFGLVPDNDGFVFYKDLLKAIKEEPGWNHVRQGSINEVLIGKDRALFQPEERRIRAIDRNWSLDMDRTAQSLPKILFMGIRRRAHPIIMEKGLRKIKGTYHVLATERAMAKRIGKRRDQHPVVLEIMAVIAQKDGGLFYPFGDLFLTPEISAKHIAGPQVSKDMLKAREEKSAKKEHPLSDFQSGTFVMDMNRDMDQFRKLRGRKKKGWKEKARRHRKKGPQQSF